MRRNTSITCRGTQPAKGSECSLENADDDAQKGRSPRNRNAGVAGECGSPSGVCRQRIEESEAWTLAKRRSSLPVPWRLEQRWQSAEREALNPGT